MALQIIKITGTIVVCLNLMDKAKHKGVDVQVQKLSEELGVPVIPTVDLYIKGMNALLKAIEKWPYPIILPASTPSKPILRL